MKRPTFLIAAALLTALPLFAEEKAPAKEPAPAAAAPPAAAPPADNTAPPLAPAEKDADRLELMPSRPSQLLPAPTGLSLIPEVPLPPEPSRPRGVESPIRKRDSATANAEDLIKQRIRMREAKTKAQRDPAVQAEWDRAAAVRTDYEKREALKGYYRLLYGRMAKVDPALKPAIDKQLQESLSQLGQTKIAPTQPPATVADGPRAKR